MINTRPINTRFSVRHQLKIMDGILKETYEGKPRYTLRKGRSSTDCLKFNVHPVISQGKDQTIVKVEYTDFHGYTRCLDMRVKIEEAGTHAGEVFYKYDEEKKQQVFESIGSAVDRLIHRVFTLDCLVHDNTAIPIYI